MAGSPGLYSYDVKASAIGLTPVTSTLGVASANTAALQAALGSLDTGADKPIRVDFDGGPYHFNGQVDVPCERRCTFDLRGGTLVNLHATEPIFRLKLQNDNGWYASLFELRDGEITGTGGAVGTYNAGPLDPRVSEFRMERLRLSTTKRPVVVTMQYTVSPLIADCKFWGNANQEGGIYWAPGRVERHGSSMMRILRCHFMQNNNRKYPSMWFSGGRGLEIDGCIFEGAMGWAAGVDPTAWERAVGIYMENWGFYQTVIRHCWFEYVDYGTRNVDYDIVLKNGQAGNMGVNAPRNIVLEHMVPLYHKFMNDAGTYHPYTVFYHYPIGVVARQTHAGVTTVGPVGVQVHGGTVDNMALSLTLPTDPNQKLQREAAGPDSAANYTATWYEPAAEPLYVYPGGGVGNDGSGITPGNTTGYPHKHPVYGAGVAFRGYGYVLTIPTARRPDGIRTLHTRLRVCSPNHVLRGGAAPGLWAAIQAFGESAQYRMIPAGYAPAEVCGGTATNGWANRGMSLEDWFSTYPGGAYQTPATPWILIYGLSASYNRPFPLVPQFGPVRFLERAAGAGPPAGTYEFGDTVVALDGGLPHVCDQPGTSRTIAKTCNATAGSAVLTGITAAGDILEGDYLTLSGVTRARVLTVADNGNITLDTTVPANKTGTALTNKPPSFARRRV